MTTGRSRWKTSLIAIGAVGVGLILVAAWQLGLLTPEPDEVSLADTVATLAESNADDEPEAEPQAEEPDPQPPAQSTPAQSTPTPSSTADPTEGSATAESTDPAPGVAADGTLDGAWAIVESEATFAGYRADSRTGEAVGRSRGVTGSLVAEGSSITAVEVEVDMTRMTSDSRVRDDHLGDEGIEWRVFPTSSFRLTEAIVVDPIPAEGAETSFTAFGDLTVREITRPVTVVLEAVRVGDQLVVVGSTPIVLDDFGAAISGTSEAVMEFSLVFER